MGVTLLLQMYNGRGLIGTDLKWAWLVSYRLLMGVAFVVFK